MNALCVRQPWAELIARGVKDLEIRTWRTDYRGPLLIVASSQIDSYGRAGMALRSLRDRDCPTSTAVAVVQLTRIETIRAMVKETGRTDVNRRACCAPYPDEYAWILSDVRRVAPVHVRGKLRIFDVPDAQIRIVGKRAA